MPKGSTAEEATEAVIKQIPTIAAQNKAGELAVENVDVFCEKGSAGCDPPGVFSIEQSRRILAAGKDANLNINFHGDELNYTGSGELAGELGALAVSHLEKISEEGIQAMAKRPSFAVLLPTTAYTLRLHPPPARRLIEQGVPVALGTDFNPNAHCMSMPFVMNLACILMHMNMNEALVAATLNSAGPVAPNH